MNELKNYVDSLFKKYNKGKYSELKAEILANLEAKKADLISQGLSENDAVQTAKQSIKSIDYLIEDNVKVNMNSYRLDYTRAMLIYAAICWIITSPMMIVNNFMSIIWGSLTITSLVSYLYRRKETDEFIKTLNISSYKKLRMASWILWSVFYAVCLFVVTGTYFGSSLLFDYSVGISGAYDVARVLVSYVAPATTISFVLVINSLPKYIYINGVTNNEE